MKAAHAAPAFGKAPIHTGTAGWSVPSRFADAVPAEGSHLARYATRLDVVEINTSFYRPHRPSTYVRWAEAVPAGFRFSVKLPRTVTHERRLVDGDDLIARFLGEAGALGDKLGVLLVQLPPSLAFDGRIAAGFFDMLRARSAVAIACEARHGSWFSAEADAVLRAYEVGRVAADPAPVAGAEETGGWSGLAYFRFHGAPQIYYSDYDAAHLDVIASRVIALARDRPVWCIFDNTAASHAFGNALDLVARIEAAS